MKKFFLYHPYITGIFAFILVTGGGSVLGVVIGILIVTTDTTQPLSPSDPHDGAAMASGMIAGFIIVASLICGLFAGLVTTTYLRKGTIKDN